MGDEAEVEQPPEPVPPISDEELEERRVLFAEIFAGLGPDEAKAKSLAERKEKEPDEVRGLTYAEMDIDNLHYLLCKVKTEICPLFAGKGVFLDLGSGVGKACIAAALLHPFEKVVGIETLQSLADCATASVAKYQEMQVPDGTNKVDIELVKADFVADFDAKVDPLADRVVVCFAMATGFAEEQLKAITTLAKKMPDNSVLITFTHRLPESLLIDPNRSPAQRRAIAVKKALAVRGTEPDQVDIVVEPPENDPHGWTQLFAEELQLHFGPATAFVFKKVPTTPPEEPVAEQPPDE